MFEAMAHGDTIEVRPRMIIDTDPGHDDLIAILVAAQVAEIVALTVVSGNAPLRETVTNTLVAAEMAGFDGPVFAGAERPLERDPAHAGEIHGNSGLGGAPRPVPVRSIDGEDAVEAILDLVDDSTWIVPIGPLTNVARALTRDPDLPSRIAGISLMGGAAETGNVTPVAEFNIWCDPEAADIVFRCGADIVMCGLDLTQQVRFDERWIDDLGNDYVRSLLHEYLRNCRDVEAASAPLHDPCAVLAVARPDWFQFTSRPVEVECSGTLTRGMTVVDRRGRAGSGNVRVAESVDAHSVLDAASSAIAAATTR